jgi:hypothetical protein
MDALEVSGLRRDLDLWLRLEPLRPLGMLDPNRKPMLLSSFLSVMQAIGGKAEY